ncbi:uncharacterized protein [Palaemon carinicauda]|uniref:uncharacterized protein isoform X2 n=1 Tax=Palaemon carinicauda TaxID=392227 RepID=UPI0035B68659
MDISKMTWTQNIKVVLRACKALSKMTEDSADRKYLIFIVLLILPVLTTAGHGKEISNPPENELSKQSCSDTDLEVDGTFIKSNLSIFFRMGRYRTIQWVREKLRSEVKNQTDKSCEDLIDDESFTLDYLQTDTNTVLWYPVIHVKNESMRETVRELFNNCNKTSTKAKATYMSSLPWQCEFQNDTRNYSKTLMYLQINNQTLLEKCKDVLCLDVYTHLSNVTFINLTDSTPDHCKKELENSVSCSEDKTLCSHSFKIPQIEKGIVFITNDTNKLDATQKKVTILSNFMTPKDKPWCKHPLNYTTQARIIQNIYQTFYYCHGDPGETDTSHSWVFAHISEKESIVALNGNINHSIISLNYMLQALIASNVIINTTVYRSFEASNITLEYHTELFNIPVFKSNQSAKELLQKIEVENITKVEGNEHFTKLTDYRSIWSPLNLIIFHNCTDHAGDKNLYLFWRNETDSLESLCNNNTVVLLTSIRRASVTFNDITRERTYYDGSLHTYNSEHCQSLIKDGSDYETRFFQFLVYPATLDMTSLRSELPSKFKENNANKIFWLTFGYNKHPDLRGGILNLTKPFDLKKEENTFKEPKESESIQKILQILVIANLTNNADCIENIQNNKFSIEITDVSVIISLGAYDISSAPCLKILPLSILKDSNTIFYNKFWPTCNYNQITASNKIKDENSEWQYLPDSCKIKETILFAVVCMITTITITGNILVITIIIVSKLFKKHAFMLYMSLALADLLIGLTSSLQAVIDTHSLMEGQLTMYNLTDKGPLEIFEDITENQLRGFNDLKFRREGWAAFTGITMNISIMSSLITLALLGIDHLLMLKMLYFKDRHIRIAIITTWLWNITCSLLIGIKDKGSLEGYFDPVTKLTLNIGTNDYWVSSIVFKTQLFIGGIAGIIVITASIASLIVYNFVELKNNQQAIRIHDQRRGEKIQVVTRTFLMMVSLFLVSCSPIAYTIIIKTFANEDGDFSIHPLYHFIIWWLCVAGCSWNWLIYSFKGTYFKQEAKKVWNKYF